MKQKMDDQIKAGLHHQLYPEAKRPTEAEVRQELIEQVGRFCADGDYGYDEKSWGYEEGILLTPFEAELLLNILNERAKV